MNISINSDKQTKNEKSDFFNLIPDYSIISPVQSNAVFHVFTVIRTSLGFFLLINKFV